MFKTVVEVEGMACGMCEGSINDSIRKNFDVIKVTASKNKKRVEIISKKQLSKTVMQQVISEKGYSINSIDSFPYEKKARFPIFKNIF